MNRILTVIYNLVGTARVKIVRKKPVNAHYLSGMADIDLSFNGHNSLVSYEEELNRHFDDFEMEIEEEMGRRQSRSEMFAQLHRYRRNVTDKLLMLFPSQNKEQFLFERVVIENAMQELQRQLEELTGKVELLQTQLAKITKAKNILVGDDAYVEVNDAAAYMGVSRRSFYRLMNKGHIPYTYIGSQRRILTSDLNKYLKKHRIEKGYIL